MDNPTKHKSLGLWRLTALVAGNMIGSGMFMLPASLAAYGSIGLVGWLISAIGAIALALIFSRLSRLLPKAGGPYRYCRQAYGDFIGFKVAYHYWIAAWVGNAALVVALVGYLSVFFPILTHNNLLATAMGLTVLWTLTGVNLLGIRQAGIVQVLTTILKVVPLIVVILWGMFHVNFSHLGAFNVSGKSNLSALASTIILTLWSFIGLESATVPADHVIEPEKNIPRATILGTLMAAFIYISATLIIMGLIPMGQLANSSAPFAEAASVLLGSWGGGVIAVVAVIACIGTLNGWLLLQAQMPMAAAKDRLFPSIFGKLSKNGVPAFGLILSSALITGILLLRDAISLVDQFTFVISVATTATLIPYFYSVMAEWLILLKKPNRKRQRATVVLTLTGLTYTLWALYGSGQVLIFGLFFLMLSSVPVYILVQKRQSISQNHPNLPTS